MSTGERQVRRANGVGRRHAMGVSNGRRHASGGAFRVAVCGADALGSTKNRSDVVLWDGTMPSQAGFAAIRVASVATTAADRVDDTARQSRGQRAALGERASDTRLRATVSSTRRCDRGRVRVTERQRARAGD